MISMIDLEIQIYDGNVIIVSIIFPILKLNVIFPKADRWEA